MRTDVSIAGIPKPPVSWEHALEVDETSPVSKHAKKLAICDEAVPDGAIVVSTPTASRAPESKSGTKQPAGTKRTKRSPSAVTTPATTCKKKIVFDDVLADAEKQCMYLLVALPEVQKPPVDAAEEEHTFKEFFGKEAADDINS